MKTKLNQEKQKQTSIRTPIIIFTAIMLLVLIVVNGIILYKSILNSTERTLGEFGTVLASSYSKEMNVEKYKEFLNNKHQSNTYWYVRDALNKFREESGAFYVYTIETDEDKNLHILIDGLPREEENVAAIGELTTATKYEDIKDVLNGKTSSTPIVHDPKFGDYLSAFAPIKDNNGQIIGILGIDIKADTASSISGTIVEEQGILLIGINLIVLIIAIVGMAIYTRKTLNPLQKLVEYADKIASGNLKVYEMNYTKNNEIGHIFQSFSNMRQGLHELIMNVKLTTDTTISKFQNVKEEMYSIKEQTSGIVLASEEISSGNEVVTSSMENTASLNHDLLQNMEKVNEEIVLVQNMNDEVFISQNKSLHSLDELVKINDVTKETFNEVSTAIETLNGFSEKIEVIVKEIKNISDQTNLLSLNASIEAARAGEHGKGFAVVATEVGKLAKQSGDATKMIQETILNIQTQITETKSKTDHTLLTFLEQNNELDSVKNNVHSLSDLLSKTKGSFDQISSMFTEMNNQQAKINDDIMSVTAVCEETAAATEEVTATIQQMDSNIKQFSNDIDEVSISVQHLKEQTHDFVI